MPSIAELSGAFATWAFVPANVIDSQAQTQKDLQVRADRLNSNVPQTLAFAAKSGVMTDGAARKSLSDMNSSLYLVSQSDRELGEEVGEIIKDSAAKAPSVLADAVHGGINQIGASVWRAIPWWVWALAAAYVGLQVLPLLATLRRK